jgi:hypothetical protein
VRKVTFIVVLVCGGLVPLLVCGTGCTETPSYFPPCLDPYNNYACPELEAGADAADAADAADSLGPPDGGPPDADDASDAAPLVETDAPSGG